MRQTLVLLILVAKQLLCAESTRFYNTLTLKFPQVHALDESRSSRKVEACLYSQETKGLTRKRYRLSLWLSRCLIRFGQTLHRGQKQAVYSYHYTTPGRDEHLDRTCLTTFSPLMKLMSSSPFSQALSRIPAGSLQATAHSRAR